ncbi:hypothetical protein RR46_12332 [Papilio xuthus]|uniref:Uncharacterized protein n=1 Tax=Papilio xuthus TaxID=66420 RepID=A0A194PSL5_PAPXU|nr:hypothetical protein RR46_12332 [Papilio xuthus]
MNFYPVKLKMFCLVLLNRRRGSSAGDTITDPTRRPAHPTLCIY